MRRPAFRRTLRLESLESREVMSTAGPSAQAQYMLELINLARTNPQAAAQEFTTNLDADVTATLNYYKVDLNQVRSEIASSPVRPPLAWNDQLAQAATGMATDQAVNGFQSHTGSDGSNLGQRLDRAGYANRAASGENTYAYSESVDQAMEAFLIDWGVSDSGHRNNLLQPTATSDQFYREVGIGIVPTQNPAVGPLVITQDFGSQNGAKAELLGVAYNDQNGNGQFDLNEGQGGVEVDATNLATGATSTTQTWDSGGYQIALDPGQYQVQAKLNGSVIDSQQVSIQTQNVQVDYNLSSLSKNPQIAAQVVVPTSTTPTPTPAATPAQAPASSSSGSWSSWTV